MPLNNNVTTDNPNIDFDSVTITDPGLFEGPPLVPALSILALGGLTAILALGGRRALRQRAEWVTRGNWIQIQFDAPQTQSE